MRTLIGKRDAERAAAMVAAGILTRENSCDGKMRHPTQNDARHAAKETARHRDRKATYYKCQFCDGYHVTRLRHGEDEEC